MNEKGAFKLQAEQASRMAEKVQRLPKIKYSGVNLRHGGTHWQQNKAMTTAPREQFLMIAVARDARNIAECRPL